MKEQQKDVYNVHVLDVPAWIVTRLRVRAAQKGERGYGKELIRVLEEHYNKQEDK